MTLYLMRHGHAEDRTLQSGDSQRHLTTKGVERTEIVASALRSIGVTIDLLISSPFVRARQTADIVAPVLKYDGDIEEDRRITPSGSYAGIAEILNEHADIESLLITGHEPSLGTMISGLCAGGNLLVEVKKSSVHAISIGHLRPSPTGILLWILTPKIVEGLAIR